MNDSNREIVKEKLVLKYHKLKRDIEELKDLTQPEAPDCAVGRVSRMDAINNRSVNEATLRKKKLQLSNIEIALKEIEQENFGQCIKCGKSIQIERIMLMPESKVCIDCAG